MDQRHGVHEGEGDHDEEREGLPDDVAGHCHHLTLEPLALELLEEASQVETPRSERVYEAFLQPLVLLQAPI